MQQLIISIFLHLTLLIIVSISQINNKSTKQSGGCAPGSGQIISVTLKADIPKSKSTQKKITKSAPTPDKKNLMLIKDKKEKKQIAQPKQKKPIQSASTEKTTSKEKSQGKGIGIGKNTTGKGSGDAESIASKESILKSQINEIIKQNWNPPDEYAARGDIVITVKISFNSIGEILGYNFTKYDENKIEYIKVAQSIARAVEIAKDDEDLKKIIIEGKITYINLIFCPRDGI